MIVVRIQAWEAFKSDTISREELVRTDSGRRICHGLRQIGSITVHHAWFRLELGIIWRNCVCKRNGRRADPGPIEANRRELGRISFGVYPV